MRHALHGERAGCRRAGARPKCGLFRTLGAGRTTDVQRLRRVRALAPPGAGGEAMGLHALRLSAEAHSVAMHASNRGQVAQLLAGRGE